MKLRIGHLSTFYHTAILLMARRDIERRLGIEVEWKLHGTGPSLVQAYEKSEIDIAYIGLPPAIIGIDRGVTITCIAGGHVEGTVISGGSMLTGFPETADLREVLAQFRGQTIGVPGKGSIHDVILAELLDRGGLREAVTVRNFAWSDQITEAAVKGLIAAAVGTPALGVALRRYAGFKLLCPASRVWPNNPSYGIVAGRDFLLKERAVILQFLGIHEEATAFLRDSPGEAAEIISRFIGFIDAGFVLETLQMSPKYCADLSEDYMQSTLDFVSCLRRLGYIKRDIHRAEIFDVSLIRAVHPGPSHYGAVPARVS
ncbi:MAG: ABC transporter substrate-binding protein [Thermodesulfovibrionales bacterium]